ncbi:MAG: NAD-dependent epimerase/dehydratase family protein [Candidatus Nealsonbacteria bacterium]
MINLEGKKILITGAHGFVGKHLVANLLEKRKIPKENLFLPSAEDLDLKKWENCEKAVKNQEIVIHLAALTGGIDFHQSNPGRIFYDNIMMGVQLMEAARISGVEKFIGIGSATEYPQEAQAPFKESELWSGLPENIHAPYSFAKKMLLVQGQAYFQQYNFNAIHLLLANMFGPGMSIESGYVIFSLIKRIEDSKKTEKKSIEVWGTGKPARDFLYVEDAVEGVLLAAEKYDKPEPVNIGSGQETSISDLTAILCRLMDFRGEIHWNSLKPDGQLRRLLDTSRAEEDFGFKAKTSLEDGLLKTIKWYNDFEK